MDMTFREWLTGLLVAIMVCLALTPFAFRNSHWLRPFAYVFAGIQFANGIGHILTTILGGTVPSVRFEGVGPGFSTAPLLLLSSAYLFWRLRTTAYIFSNSGESSLSTSSTMARIGRKG